MAYTMPLSQSPIKSSGPSFSGWRQKRKVTADCDSMEFMDNHQNGNFATPAKRSCLWVSDTINTINNRNAQMNESLPGCLNDSSAAFFNQNQDMDMMEEELEEAHQNNNKANESTPASAHGMEQMNDAEPVTPCAHQGPSSVPNLPTPDQTSRCGYLSCSGRRSSPISGRMFCHCSASWRGMYGMDNGYITDYY